MKYITAEMTPRPEGESLKPLWLQVVVDPTKLFDRLAIGSVSGKITNPVEWLISSFLVKGMQVVNPREARLLLAQSADMINEYVNISEENGRSSTMVRRNAESLYGELEAGSSVMLLAVDEDTKVRSQLTLTFRDLNVLCSALADDSNTRDFSNELRKETSTIRLFMRRGAISSPNYRGIEDETGQLGKAIGTLDSQNGMIRFETKSIYESSLQPTTVYGHFIRAVKAFMDNINELDNVQPVEGSRTSDQSPTLKGYVSQNWTSIAMFESQIALGINQGLFLRDFKGRNYLEEEGLKNRTQLLRIMLKVMAAIPYSGLTPNQMSHTMKLDYWGEAGTNPCALYLTGDPRHFTSSSIILFNSIYKTVKKFVDAGYDLDEIESNITYTIQPK